MLVGLAFFKDYMTFQEWKKKQLAKKATNYVHFDFRTGLDRCVNYITDPQKVSVHAFYPFIHFTKIIKRVKNGHKADPKEREIYYASYIDSWIYRYYSYLINEKYNEYLAQTGLSSVSVAYRTNLSKNNIHLAYEAFSFIKKAEVSYVMIGDFTNFFDSLDHAYLRKSLCSLLEVNELAPDFYAVFKSVTKFHFFDLQKLLSIRHLDDSKKGRRALKSLNRILSPKELRQFKNLIESNPNSGFGIPQGSPISAVFANIYMIQADMAINKVVLTYGGLYMRYSDDFIVVLPNLSKEEFAFIYESIKSVIYSIPRLNLKEEKTKLFYVTKSKAISVNSEFTQMPDTKDIIDFLGFSFDGTCVRVKDKTVSKYYHRLNRKIKTISKNGGISPKGKKISCKNLYEKYSYKGSCFHKKKTTEYKRNHDLVKIHGNFLDYIERSKIVFENEPVDTVLRNHMRKIKSRLKLSTEKTNGC